MKRIGFIALLWIAAWCSAAHAKDDFLPPEQAYKYTTRFEGEQLFVDWQIEAGYYLYRERMGALTSVPGVQLTPQWPKGEDHEDEFFGKKEIYRGKVTLPFAVSFAATRPATLPIELKLQGCADAGLCFPPLKWKTEVVVPTGSAANPERLDRVIVERETGRLPAA